MASCAKLLQSNREFLTISSKIYRTYDQTVSCSPDRYKDQNGHIPVRGIFEDAEKGPWCLYGLNLKSA
jgi:hypothetical protein